MNLRKDHSHAIHIIHLNTSVSGSGGWERELVHVPTPPLFAGHLCQPDFGFMSGHVFVSVRGVGSRLALVPIAMCRVGACPRHAAWSVVGCPWHRPLGSAMSSPVGLPTNSLSQLAATDVSAQTTMKDAAKCDKHCEMQNSVNQQTFERTLRCRVTPGSMSTSVSIFFFLRSLLKTAGAQ